MGQRCWLHPVSNLDETLELTWTFCKYADRRACLIVVNIMGRYSSKRGQRSKKTVLLYALSRPNEPTPLPILYLSVEKDALLGFATC